MKSRAPGRRSPAALLRGRGGWLWVLGLLVAVQLVFIAGHLVAFAATEGSSTPREARQLLDFNQEGSLPTYWSALVLAWAGVLALVIRRGTAWLLAGAGLTWIGLEEAFIHLHEDLQIGTGIDWPVLYAPLLVAGAWILFEAARDLDRTGRRLLIAGLACMVAGVGAELLSSPAIALDFQTRNLVEENLELAGTGLVLCAFASWLWPAAVRGGHPGRPRTGLRVVPPVSSRWPRTRRDEQRRPHRVKTLRRPVRAVVSPSVRARPGRPRHR